VTGVGENDVKPSATPQSINRLESARGNQPGSRIVGNSTFNSLSHRQGKRLMHRLLSQIKIPQQPHQRGKHSPRLGPVELINRSSNLIVTMLSLWMTEVLRFPLTTIFRADLLGMPNSSELHSEHNCSRCGWAVRPKKVCSQRVFLGVLKVETDETQMKLRP
jgi:hypothetical protein